MSHWIEVLESRWLASVTPGGVMGTVQYQFPNHGSTVVRPLAGWTVYADDNDNGVLDAGEVSAVSGLDGTWTLPGLSAGPHTVREVVPAGWTQDGSSFAAVADPSSAAGIVFDNEMTAPAVIDVMVLYTPSARDVAGSDPNVISDIQRQLDDADQVLGNSNCNARFNLIYCNSIKYSESGNVGTDLTRLARQKDGSLDTVGALRNAVGADLVVLYTDDSKSKSDVIGEGYEFSNSPGEGAYGYSVVTDYTGSQNLYTMAHELGHNLGANHDPAHAISGAPYPFAYGAVFTGDDGKKYQDIMSYGNGTILPIYSTPDFDYAGVAAGSATEDNALAVRESAPIVAAYRSASASVPGPLIADELTTLASNSRRDTATLRLTNQSAGRFRGTVEVRYYASTDAVFDTSDVEVGTLRIGHMGLASDRNKLLHGRLMYPTTLPNGSYYLLAVVTTTGGAAPLVTASSTLVTYQAPVALPRRGQSIVVNAPKQSAATAI